MGRLFAFLTPPLLAAIAIGLTVSPALAEVCDKVLGEGSTGWPMHAGLWRHLLNDLLSFPVLIVRATRRLRQARRARVAANRSAAPF